MPIPSITNQEVNGLLRSSPGPSSLVCVLGCSSLGSTAFVLLTSRVTDLVANCGYGPGVELAAVKAAAGKQVAFLRLPSATPGTASAVIKTGTGTSIVTVTGAPFDNYQVAVAITASGTIATVGIKFVYSLNGDFYDRSMEYSLGTATTFAIPNTNITLNFAAGTVVAGDYYNFTTVAPAFDVAGLQAGIELLRTSSIAVDCFALAGDASAAVLQAMSVKIKSLKTHGKHTWGLAHYSLPTGGAQTPAQYRDTTSTALQAVSSDVIGLAAWSCRHTSAVSGFTLVRSPLYPALDVLTPDRISENSASISGHAIPAILMDISGALFFQDALYDDGLSDRCITLRSWPGQPGIYLTRARLLSAPADSAQLIVHRRVVNRAEQTADAYWATIVHTPIKAAPNGTIAPEEALRIQAGLQSALQDALGNDCSRVVYILDKSINILTTSTIQGDIYVQPYGYPEFIITRVALVAQIAV